LKPTSASISEFIYLTMLQTDQIIWSRAVGLLEREI
jgi:hypothetical protein